MTTREELLQRPDIPDADVDDIVAIAAELQAADQRGGATVAQVQAVARELDVDPVYVEEALGVLRQRRQAEVSAALKGELQARERRRVGMIVAGTAIVVVLLLLSVQVAQVRSAAATLQAARTNLEHSASYVDIVLDRQAALVPQLVALSGGDAEPLHTQVTAMRQAPDLQARLQASHALDVALAQVLAELPPPADDTQASQRLGLVHELTGVQNRLTTETRRYHDAVRAWKTTASSRGGRLALWLGLVTPPGT